MSLSAGEKLEIIRIVEESELSVRRTLREDDQASNITTAEEGKSGNDCLSLNRCYNWNVSLNF